MMVLINSDYYTTGNTVMTKASQRDGIN